jgi:predicted DNA-binding protein (UPF0251 family)
MKSIPAFFFALMLAALSASAVAQDGNDIVQARSQVEKCKVIDPDNESKDIRYKNCFDAPDDSFYGQAYVDFSIRNTDFNGLIEQSEKAVRKDILKTLGSLFVSSTDVAHFVLVAEARNPDGTRVSLGGSKLFSIRKTGNKKYALSSESRYGPLPVRFLADSNSTVEFDLGVIVERQVESRVASILGKLADLAGISLPSIPGLALTTPQEQFVKLDEELSALLSSQQVISTFVPLHFDPRYVQAYQTTFAFRKFLPEGAGLQLRIESSIETSIFPQADSDSARGMAAPGGLRSEQFKNTKLMGQPLVNHVVAGIGPDSFNDLRQLVDNRRFYDACWKLQSFLERGPLSLTAPDQLRIMWAHVSGSPLLKDREVREKYCLANKENDLRALGLGLPELEAVRLSDSHFLVFEQAQSEAEMAQSVVDAAILLRDEALAAADNAARQIDPSRYGFADLTGMQLAGEIPTEGQTFLSAATEYIGTRKGNTYAGELIRIGDTVVFQGLGQYTSVNPGDDIGFKSYIGQWEGNFGTGNGEIRSHDGYIFIGQISREKPHGFGKWIHPDGKVYYVRMSEGEPTGLVVREDRDGKRVGGQFIASGIFRPDEE